MFRVTQEWFRTIERDTPMMAVTLPALGSQASEGDRSGTRVAGDDDIDASIRGVIESSGGYAHRVLLSDDDPLALDAADLVRVGDRIARGLVDLETITMRTTIGAVARHDVKELVGLRGVGFDQPYVDLSFDSLPGCPKLASELPLGAIARELGKLGEAGMRFAVALSFERVQTGQAVMFAEMMAGVLNLVRPWAIVCVPAGDSSESGAPRLSNCEAIAAQRRLVELAELDDCYFFGSHAGETVRVSGQLGTDRERMMASIDRQLVALECPVSASWESFGEA